MASQKKQTPVHRKVHRRARKHAKLALVPHSANQFRPHLIRRHGLVMVLVFVIVAQLIGHGGLLSNVLGQENTIAVPELLESTNRERSKVGLSPLRLNERLSEAAYMKAQDMLARQYWDHNSPDGVPPWKWFGDVQYNYAYAGENLARNFHTSDAVVQAWMNSPAHRANILKDRYQDVGFATVDGMMNGRNASLVVALYGQPALSEAAVQGAQFSVARTNTTSIVSRMGIAVQSMDALVIGSMVITVFTAMVALIAHAYRWRLPKSFQGTWRHHHGLIKAAGLTSLVVVVLAAYGLGGQI
ncbi:MAG: CAP domain-containing protein [Candidatus Saccharimonadales bacterium]